METIEAFSSQVISVKAEKAYTGECINVMTQVLQTEESALPQGLTIQNMYTELWKGSKYVVIMEGTVQPSPKCSERKLWWPQPWLQLQCWKYQQRLGCERGRMNLRILIHLF